jgi:hypothetical protein
MNPLPPITLCYKFRASHILGNIIIQVCHWITYPFDLSLFLADFLPTIDLTALWKNSIWCTSLSWGVNEQKWVLGFSNYSVLLLFCFLIRSHFVNASTASTINSLTVSFLFWVFTKASLSFDVLHMLERFITDLHLKYKLDCQFLVFMSEGTSYQP